MSRIYTAGEHIGGPFEVVADSRRPAENVRIGVFSLPPAHAADGIYNDLPARVPIESYPIFKDIVRALPRIFRWGRFVAIIICVCVDGEQERPNATQ